MHQPLICEIEVMSIKILECVATPSSIDEIDCCDVVYFQSNACVRLISGKCLESKKGCY